MSNLDIALSDDYYLEDFEHVVAHALERYAFLLEPGAVSVLRRFGSL